MYDKVKSFLFYVVTGTGMALVVSFGVILFYGMFLSMLPRTPLTVKECRERIECLDYLMEHEDVAREMIHEVYQEVLYQSEQQSTRTSRQVGDRTITYSGYWSPNGIPESMWKRWFRVESEDFSCRVEVDTMYTDVEGDGMRRLFKAERASLEARIEAAIAENIATP